jgi:hypothetical protein
VNDADHESLTFRDPVVFLEWLRDNRPKVYKKVEKKFLPPALHPGVTPSKGSRRRKKDRAEGTR